VPPAPSLRIETWMRIYEDHPKVDLDTNSFGDLGPSFHLTGRGLHELNNLYCDIICDLHRIDTSTSTTSGFLVVAEQ
jgi:hypothetical protein